MRDGPRSPQWTWPIVVGLALLVGCGTPEEAGSIEGGGVGGTGGSGAGGAGGDPGLRADAEPDPDPPARDGGTVPDTGSRRDGAASVPDAPRRADTGAEPDARAEPDVGPTPDAPRIPDARTPDATVIRDTASATPDTAAPPADTGGGAGDGLPDNAYCRPVNNWSAAWSALEQQVLTLVNETRARGVTCGGTAMPPVPPLTMDPALRCAARVHSKDMVDRDFFDHTNPSNEGPSQRITKAGYRWMRAGENIAAGSATAQATVNQWLSSEGHCENLMSAQFRQMGLGYYPGGQYRHYWTQTLATPR
jgi:uncharacterized protein YkwD